MRSIGHPLRRCGGIDATLVALLASAMAGPSISAARADAPPPIETPPAAARTPLWFGLAAGMTPPEVAAVLATQGVRAHVRTDRQSGHQYVEPKDSAELAGRRTKLAFGFVDGGLFYMDAGSQRTHGRRVPLNESHFMRVVAVLTEKFGPPISADPAPIITQRDAYGHAETVRAKFDGKGVRADVVSHSHYGGPLGLQVEEVVNVRFWRTEDARAVETGRKKVRMTTEKK